MPDFRIEVLARAHRPLLKDFQNQEPSLVTYLKRYALRHAERDLFSGRRVERVTEEAPVAGPAPYLSIQHAGFSLNAAVYIPADDPEALERLCRYILRPAIAQKRLQLLEGDRVALTLRHPWRDGTKQLIFDPLDFIARVSALIPAPGNGGVASVTC